MKLINLQGEPGPSRMGDLLDDNSYDSLYDEDVKITTPDGRVLAILLKDVLDKRAADRAYTHLHTLRTVITNRSTAAKGKSRKAVLDNGTISKTSRVSARDLRQNSELRTASSSIVGSFDRTGARFPFCRQTAWTRDHVEQWGECQDYIRDVNAVFRKHAPDRYAAQQAVCAETDPAWIIPGTVFTTVTVNRNWQIRVHEDAGDFKPGLGVLSAFSRGNYDGCYLCFPRWRVAFNMRAYDVILANVHEQHGSTTVRARGHWERISCVFYYREKMQACGTPGQEQERALKFKKGGSVADLYR